MKKQDISKSIYEFTKECKDKGLCFDYISGKGSVKVKKVDYGESIEFEADSINGVKWRIVDSFSEYYANEDAVHCTDPEGDSNNWQASFETVLAHHPNVGACYINNRKHTSWFDHVIHRPGEIIVRDNFCRAGELEDSIEVDWTAPEWCLAIVAKQYLDDNPSDEDKLYEMLTKATIHDEKRAWRRKVRLLRGEDPDYPRQTVLIDENQTTRLEHDRAEWYSKFCGGNYGEWGTFFDKYPGSSLEEGLAEKAVYLSDEGSKLCKLLGLEEPDKVSGMLGDSRLIYPFIRDLRNAGMHIEESGSASAELSSEDAPLEDDEVESVSSSEEE